MSDPVRPSPIKPSRLRWGYDNEQHDPGRRVSVSPAGMLTDTYMLSAEARGLLLEIFCRYWEQDKPIQVERFRRPHDFTGKNFDAALRELIEESLISVRDGAATPAKSFGGEAKEATEKRPGRSIPKDWQELRDAVFERDGFGCVYCGSGRDLHCDHVEPLVLGGSNDIGNLVTACATCNLSKGPKSLQEWRPDIYEQWRR